MRALSKLFVDPLLLVSSWSPFKSLNYWELLGVKFSKLSLRQPSVEFFLGELEYNWRIYNITNALPKYEVYSISCPTYYSGLEWTQRRRVRLGNSALTDKYDMVCGSWGNTETKYSCIIIQMLLLELSYWRPSNKCYHYWYKCTGELFVHRCYHSTIIWCLIYSI